MTRKQLVLLYVVLPLISLWAFCTLPVYDDWYYLSSPQFRFDPDLFLPGDAFWRPIDGLIGLLNGQYPFLFPYLNHLIVLCAYFYVWWQLKVLLQRHGRAFPSFIALALFTVSPALVAGVYSVDSINQALSLAFGVASLVWFPRSRWLAYLFMILSLFSKENGIVWFGLTPLLSLLVLENRDEEAFDWRIVISRLWRPALCSILLLVVYFIARLSLQNVVPEGEASVRYASGLGWNSLKGLGILLSGALTCIDTIALFIENNQALVIATTLVSLFFLLALAYGFLRVRRSPKVWILWLSILLSCVPYILMDHPGEMHAYTIVWMLSLCIGVSFPADSYRWQRIAFGLFLIVSIPVYAHKAYYIINLGWHSWTRTHNAVQATTGFSPRKVVILDCNPQGKTYSVFQMSSARIWNYGLSTNIYFKDHTPQTTDYRLISSSEVAHTVQAIRLKPNGADCLWILRGDEIECIDLRENSPT